MNAIQTLGDAVSKLGKQINDLQREVSGRKSHAHRLSLELKQSEIERQKLESRFGELRSSIDSEQGEIITELQLANDAIARLESSNSALSTDCNARQAREQELNTVIAALQSELNSLNDEIKALQFTVEKRNEAILDAIVYINSLPPWVSGADEIAITAPVEKRLLEILNQGAPK